MTKPITVRELYNMCNEILMQHWDKHIMISKDEEWNWRHWLYFWFTVDSNEVKDLDEFDEILDAGIDYKNTVLLW